MFHVVDIPGPAVVGLPMSELQQAKQLKITTVSVMIPEEHI